SGSRCRPDGSDQGRGRVSGKDEVTDELLLPGRLAGKSVRPSELHDPPSPPTESVRLTPRATDARMQRAEAFGGPGVRAAERVTIRQDGCSDSSDRVAVRERRGI